MPEEHHIFKHRSDFDLIYPQNNNSISNYKLMPSDALLKQDCMKFQADNNYKVYVNDEDFIKIANFVLNKYL